MFRFMNYWSTHFVLSQYKVFEAELIYSDQTWYRFEFTWYRKQDHAGPRFSIGLFGFEFQMKVYDTRHWDYENV
jgi:hypothetical protein